MQCCKIPHFFSLINQFTRALQLPRTRTQFVHTSCTQPKYTIFTLCTQPLININNGRVLRSKADDLLRACDTHVLLYAQTIVPVISHATYYNTNILYLCCPETLPVPAPLKTQHDESVQNYSRVTTTVVPLWLIRTEPTSTLNGTPDNFQVKTYNLYVKQSILLYHQKT